MKLIFVYNAESGAINSLIDIGHKLLNPETYKCNLCALTHNTFSEKIEWKKFKSKIPLKLEFLYKDEFKEKYNFKTELPAVLIEKNGLNVIINSEEINRLKELSELTSLLKQRIDTVIVLKK